MTTKRRSANTNLRKMAKVGRGYLLFFFYFCLDHTTRTKNQEPRTKNQETRNKNQETRTKKQEPRAKNQEPRTKS
jgi:hypothetical protein